MLSMFAAVYFSLEFFFYLAVEGYGAVTVCITAEEGDGSERVRITLTNTPITTQGSIHPLIALALGSDSTCSLVFLEIDK